MTTAAATLPCPHCRSAMGLVHQLDLEGMPEIYIFYCTSCQLAQTVKQERAQKISQIIETADAQLRNASSRSGGLTSDRA